MAQVEAPANLDKWPNPEGRLITIILIRCGLRATDACTLPFDCLLYDGQHAAYLRYFNNKMRREAAASRADAAGLVFEDCHSRLLKTLVRFSGSAAARIAVSGVRRSWLTARSSAVFSTSLRRNARVSTTSPSNATTRLMPAPR